MGEVKFFREALKSNFSQNLTTIKISDMNS